MEWQNQMGRVMEEEWKGGNMERAAKFKGHLRVAWNSTTVEAS